MKWKVWRCEACGHEVTDGHLKLDMDDEIYAGYKDLHCIAPTGGGGNGSMCLGIMAPHYHTSGRTFAIKGAPYSQPIHSDAMAIQPSQVAEHRKAFPDIKIDSQCRPVMENSEQHQKYMDACGFVKQRQSTRVGGEIIAVLGEKDAEGETETQDAGSVHEDGLD